MQKEFLTLVIVIEILSLHKQVAASAALVPGKGVMILVLIVSLSYISYDRQAIQSTSHFSLVPYQPRTIVA